jgi:hypothetical protein
MRKSSILVLSALTLFMLAACSTAKAPENTGDEANTNTANEAVVPTAATDASAKAAGDLGTCLDSCKMVEADTGLISKDTCRVGCYMAEAQGKKDPQICIANVSDALMLPACLTGVAEELGDIAVCNMIGEDKNDLMRGACYSTVVEKTKKVSDCEGIKDSMMYSGCLEAVNNG